MNPHRVKSTLENMLEVYGDRQVVLVRELTKIYEEYQGTDIWITRSYWWWAQETKCLLIVDGASEENWEVRRRLLAEIDFLMKPGSQKSKAIKESCQKTSGLNKSDLYSTYHQ